MATLLKLVRQPLEYSIFQPLEQELEPVLKYLTGRVLNAGCGNRDISRFLLTHQATAVDHCDLHSSIPGAMQCDLGRIPRSECSYDSILCNAVLEHVRFSSEVLQELRRLLKPGGHLVLTIPFLQPFHPCPGDYRRFTREGMTELGRSHQFEVMELLPVHSMAQTITWILWACLQEKGMWLTRKLLKLPLMLWCRMSNRTDFQLLRNANTYQMVLRKTETENRPLTARNEVMANC